MQREEKTGYPVFLERLSEYIERNDLLCRHDKETLESLRNISEYIRVRDALDFEEIGDHIYDGVYIADGSGKTL